MDNLEKQINKDAANLLNKAVCSTIISMDQARREFANTINDLIKAEPSLKIGGIIKISGGGNPIEIKEPDEAYIDMKKAMLRKLQENITENSNAYDIVTVYANLMNQAKYTRCFYQDDPFDYQWVEEMSRIKVMSDPWTIVKPRMG